MANAKSYSRSYVQSVTTHGDNWREAAPLIDAIALLPQELREIRDYNLMLSKGMRSTAMLISTKE